MENIDPPNKGDKSSAGDHSSQQSEQDRNRNDFHRLWTSALPARNYNKKAWLDIERQLLEIGAI